MALNSKNQLDVTKLNQESLLKEREGTLVSEEFINEHLSTVEAIASTIIGGGKAPPEVELNDLIAWGIEGLIKAKNNYKDNKGTQFKTYAFYRIRGEILDKIRLEWHHRNPVAYENYRKRVRERITQAAEEQLLANSDPNKSYDDQVKRLVESSGMVYIMSCESTEIISISDGTRNPETELIDENRSDLWDEVKKLTDDEKSVVNLFYVEGLKQVDIAKKLNYSRSKICRIHMQLLSKLKVSLSKRMND